MNRLKELRNEKNLSQAELARILDVPRNSYYQWENEINQMNYEVLFKISNYFNVSIDYLLGRTDELGNAYTEADSYTPEERRIITMLRKLPPEMKNVAIGAIEAVSKIEIQREEQADKAKKA